MTRKNTGVCRKRKRKGSFSLNSLLESWGGAKTEGTVEEEVIHLGGKGRDGEM